MDPRKSAALIPDRVFVCVCVINSLSVCVGGGINMYFSSLQSLQTFTEAMTLFSSGDIVQNARNSEKVQLKLIRKPTHVGSAAAKRKRDRIRGS